MYIRKGLACWQHDMRTGVIRAIIAAGCLSRGVWKIFLIIVDSLD